MTDVFGTVIIMSCTGAAVTALLLMLKPVSVRFFSAEWQWRIWLVAVVCMLVPLWQLLPSKEVERREPRRVAAVQTEEKSSAAADKMPDRNGQDERIDTHAPNTAPPRKASRRFHITVTRALVYRLAAYVWLLGAVVFFALALGNYFVFLGKKKRHSTAAEDTELSGGEAVYTDKAGNEYKNTATVKAGDAATYGFYVPQDARYNIKLSYLLPEGSGNDLTVKLLLDGELPFTEAESLTLPRMYKDSEDKRFDSYGNQYSPEQEEAGEFFTKAFSDITGAETLPYSFYLTAGTHSISLFSESEDFVIAKLVIAAPDELKSYSETEKYYKEQGYTAAGGNPIIIEGEEAALKSTRAIVPKSDSTSPVPHPSSSNKQIINYIGGSNWKSPGEEVVWKIKVENAGLYRLGVMFKQDQTVNGYSYRTLKIDGAVPFFEALNLKFYYGTGWQYYEFADESRNPYLFYLDRAQPTKNRPHLHSHQRHQRFSQHYR